MAERDRQHGGKMTGIWWKGDGYHGVRGKI